MRNYGDIFTRKPATPTYPTQPATLGEVVEVLADGYVGAIVSHEKTYDGDFIRLENNQGKTRLFKLRPGAFLVDGIRTTLTKPQPAARPQRSNSGSTRVVNAPQKSPPHPASGWKACTTLLLSKKIWGHDLRVEGVVVEYLEGLDNLPHRLAEFRPAQGRRVGVLADHLVAGSKETRLTDQVGEHVFVTGHPYIDIWAAVKPERLGIRAWPEIPRGEDWKTGVCARLGWANPQEGWNRVYRAVSTYKDIDSTLIGAVERLVDFVTTPELTKADLR